MDMHMSVLEGSIGVLPRRLMVLQADLSDARAVLRDNGIEPAPEVRVTGRLSRCGSPSAGGAHICKGMVTPGRPERPTRRE